MTKKFTEKQYNMLVEIQEDQYSDDLFFESKSYENSIAYTVAQKYDVLKWFIDTNDLGNEAVALMNPLTREWAHDKFIEEEERFLFTKIKKVDGDILNLNQLDGDVHIYLDGDDPTPLTIKQVEEYGYNLDAFTKTPYEHGVSEEDDDVPF